MYMVNGECKEFRQIIIDQSMSRKSGKQRQWIPEGYAMMIGGANELAMIASIPI